MNEDEALDLLARELGARPLGVGPIVMVLPATRATPAVVAIIKEVVMRHPGSKPLHVQITNGGGVASELVLPVRVSPSVRDALIEALGRNVLAPE